MRYTKGESIDACEGGGLNWYSYSGHLEKSDIETKLLEVRDGSKEEELFGAI